MTQHISQDVRIRIRGLLEYRNLIEAIRVYRKATDCGLKDAKEAVERMQDQFRQEDPEKFGRIEATRAARGATWTLIGGIAVLIASLSTVYAYVFPRFSGELVSTTATLEVRVAHQKPNGNDAPMNLPDDSNWYVSEKTIMTAGDFSKFSCVQDENGVPQLVLRLSRGGQKQLRLLKKTGNRSDFLAIFIHQKLIACVARDEWSPEGVRAALTGLSPSDTNEIFARLTE